MAIDPQFLDFFEVKEPIRLGWLVSLCTFYNIMHEKRDSQKIRIRLWRVYFLLFRYVLSILSIIKSDKLQRFPIHYSSINLSICHDYEPYQFVRITFCLVSSPRLQKRPVLCKVLANLQPIDVFPFM